MKSFKPLGISVASQVSVAVVVDYPESCHYFFTSLVNGVQLNNFNSLGRDDLQSSNDELEPQYNSD